MCRPYGALGFNMPQSTGLTPWATSVSPPSGVSFAGPITLFRADPTLNPASFQRQAPEVYERLGKVLAARGATTRVKHALRPLGVAMARRDVVDPYED